MLSDELRNSNEKNLNVLHRARAYVADKNIVYYNLGIEY